MTLQESMANRRRRHSFPPVLAKPISLIPSRLHAIFVAQVLNRLFAAKISEEELAFLENRTLCINTEDVGVRFNLSFANKQFSGIDQTTPADLILSGNLHDYLLLVTRREDSDTLFFQRRLKIEGDTEMGLAIKNFLDAIEIESLPWHHQIQGALNRALNYYERVT